MPIFVKNFQPSSYPHFPVHRESTSDEKSKDKTRKVENKNLNIELLQKKFGTEFESQKRVKNVAQEHMASSVTFEVSKKGSKFKVDVKL